MALFRDANSSQFGIPCDSTPTTLIVKPPIAGYARHHINETLCLRAAGEAGLLAAESEVFEIADVQVLISTRYDRLHDGSTWRRVHQDSMGTRLSLGWTNSAASYPMRLNGRPSRCLRVRSPKQNVWWTGLLSTLPGPWKPSR